MYTHSMHHIFCHQKRGLTNFENHFIPNKGEQSSCGFSKNVHTSVLLSLILHYCHSKSLRLYLNVNMLAFVTNILYTYTDTWISNMHTIRILTSLANFCTDANLYLILMCPVFSRLISGSFLSVCWYHWLSRRRLCCWICDDCRLEICAIRNRSFLICKN